jgi:hypothetical protein
MALTFTTLYSNSFQGPNQNPLSDGGNWILTDVPNVMPLQILNQLCVGTDGVGYETLTGVDLPLTNPWAEFTFVGPVSSTEFVIVLFLGNSALTGTYVGIAMVGGGALAPAMSLFQEPDGPFIEFLPSAINSGDVFRLAVIDAVVYAWQNGTLVLSAPLAFPLTSSNPTLEINTDPFSLTLGCIDFACGSVTGTLVSSVAGFAPNWASGQNGPSLDTYISSGSVDGGASTVFSGGAFSVPANSTTYFWTDETGVIQSGSTLPAGAYAIAKVVSGLVTTGSGGQTAPGIFSITDLRGTN